MVGCCLLRLSMAIAFACLMIHSWLIRFDSIRFFIHSFKMSCEMMWVKWVSECVAGLKANILGLGIENNIWKWRATASTSYRLLYCTVLIRQYRIPTPKPTPELQIVVVDSQQWHHHRHHHHRSRTTSWLSTTTMPWYTDRISGSSRDEPNGWTIRASISFSHSCNSNSSNHARRRIIIVCLWIHPWYLFGCINARTKTKSKTLWTIPNFLVEEMIIIGTTRRKEDLSLFRSMTTCQRRLLLMTAIVGRYPTVEVIGRC